MMAFLNFVVKCKWFTGRYIRFDSVILVCIELLLISVFIVEVHVDSLFDQLLSSQFLQTVQLR